MKILGFHINSNNDPRDHRLWIWFGENNICFEVGKLKMFGFGLNVDTEDITFGLYFYWSFYISLDFLFIRKFLYKHPNYFYNHGDGRNKGSYWDKRSISFHFNLDNWSLSMVLWDNMDYEKKRHWYIVISDKIFGNNKYREEIIDEGKTIITMPEGIYKATYKKFNSFWKRPLLPFEKKIKRIMIDIPGGIPHPGKGENSWDCGMDATFGITMPLNYSETIQEATKRVALGVLKDRQRHGSLNNPAYLEWREKHLKEKDEN